MRILYGGHFGVPSGYGRAATDNFRALKTLGSTSGSLGKSGDEQLTLMLAPFGPGTTKLPDEIEEHNVMAHGMDDAPLDALIIHTLPLDCVKAKDTLLAQLSHRPKKVIAYTTWETYTAPTHVTDALSTFDEIWTPSRMSQSAIATTPAELGKGCVHVIPHCFDPHDPMIRDVMSAAAARRGAPSPNERVQFYWIGAWNARKNPMGIIRAFCHLFSRDDDVELTLHSPGADTVQFYAALAQTGLSQLELPLISLSNARMSDEEIWQLHKRGDVFVSASRGEAWNLPAFEAMLAGSIIVAPEELGSDDFLRGATHDDPPDRHDGTNAILYQSRAELAHVTVRAQQSSTQPNQIGFVVDGAQGLTSKCLWGEPDLLTLSMELHTARSLIRQGKTGAIHYDPIQRYGYPAVAQLMLERIFS